MTDQTRPKHYTDLTPEPIEVIEAWGLSFGLGNAVKYISRAGRKPGSDAVTDLRKASYYLTREITRLSRAAATLSPPHGPDHACPDCDAIRGLIGHVPLVEFNRRRLEGT